MLSALALAAVIQGAPFTLPRLDQYNPADVDGIRFGITADKDLKKMFKVGKGAVRPEELVIGTDDQWRYDALLSGRGADAKAIAVWAEPRKALETVDLTSGLGDPERLYVRDRSSDWSVQVFPDRGIALFATRQGAREFVEAVLLTDKDHAKQLTRALEPRETEVIDLARIFESKDRRVFLRSFDLTLTRKNLNIGDVNREERLLESFAERRAESRNVRFGGGDGSISVTVSIDFEKTNVSVSLRGKNEVGDIVGNGSATARKFRVEKDVAYYRRDYVEDAVVEALDEALDSAERAIRDQRPPTEAEDRRRLILWVLNSSIK